jgi:hypothetical protein
LQLKQDESAMTTTGKTQTKKTTAQKTVQPSMIRIHFADGNKGGVGKSMLCRTLYQWFIDKAAPVTGVEADVNSPDFKGTYKEVMISRFSEDENVNGVANDIVNIAIEEKKNLVVNLPATVHTAFKLWLTSYDIVHLSADHGIELVKWFVCTGEFDSIKSLAVSLKEFGATIPHVVVRNQKYSGWQQFEEDAELQELLKKHGCKIVDLPKLPQRVAETILRNRLSFAEALTHKENGFGIVEQSAVKGYLRNAYTAFEATGYLPL